jgi:dTDP-4-dehydrorhamnose reductase
VERCQREQIAVLQTSHDNDARPQEGYYLDLAKDASTWRIPPYRSVAFICAGITGLDSCRNNPEKTRIVNVKNTLRLVEMLLGRGSDVIYLSSNLVFDGSIPFQKPEAVPSPATEYGRQKAEVESRLLGTGGPVAIVRLTKVISPSLPLFGKWIEPLNRNEPIYPFSDVRFSPIPLDFVVECLLRIGYRHLRGIIQISNDRDITYEEAARFLADRLGADPELIKPISAVQRGIPRESCNTHTTLDISRLTEELQVKPPTVWEALDSLRGGRMGPE